MADHRSEDAPLPPPRKSHRASDDPIDEGAAPTEPAASAPLGPRRRRRVTTQPPAGSDPNPISEAPRHRASENDQRLRADKPPHWG
jgi:hypothetical protein